MASHSHCQEHGWIYDVFLSFRGEDTRHNFTSHLYSALLRSGIHTFIDNDALRRGQPISSDLKSAISRSRISVVVFSENYAYSSWCLDELVVMMECNKAMGQTVLPIFYHVEPSDLRKGSGSFGAAIARYEERFEAEKVSKWKEALAYAAGLSGWHIPIISNQSEAEFIQKIIQEILNILGCTHLNVTKCPVGIRRRVQQVNSLLHIGLNDVRIVGICGMGGLGKTTIAKAVYNDMFRGFEGSSFLFDIREHCKQVDGQVRLQKQLLSDALQTNKVKIRSVDRGINMIIERLCHKKVFIVLDDVDQSYQLDALAGKRDWFGLGSRIIITTRDRHLLNEIGVDDIYMAEQLSDLESLQLFSWHAFKANQPRQEYAEISREVTGYCGGLPLAIKVLGSFLVDKDMMGWRYVLDKLERVLPTQVQEILHISYDALDNNEKDIFLDAACFFVGEKRDYVTKILDGCGLFAGIGLSVLVDRCLVTIDECNRLHMHHLIRDMGRQIVAQASPKDPANRSRLWCFEDVYDVLETAKGTSCIEGLILTMHSSQEVHFRTEAFKGMDKLRLLQLNYVHLTGGYEHVSEMLRWLCWRGFPMKYIPRNLYLGKLVALDMRYSNLRQAWKESKVLRNLKVLNVSHSPYLSNTPDLSETPNLEMLILKYCISLITVHKSIGYLHKLVTLNFKGCSNLKNVPHSIGELKSLEYLILSGCSKLEYLPDGLDQLSSLRELLADETAITELPSNIVRLTNLRTLSLQGCKESPPTSIFSKFLSWMSVKMIPKSVNLFPTSLLGLCSLTRLNLGHCNILDNTIPNDLGSLPSLEHLNLQGNCFTSLPSSISFLSKLQNFDVRYCSHLQSLPELPASLRVLLAVGCLSLERISYVPNRRSVVVLTDCRNLIEISGVEDWDDDIGLLHMESCYSLSHNFRNELFKKCTRGLTHGLFLPGREMVDGFNFQNVGPSISFTVPPLLGQKLASLAVCAIYSNKSWFSEIVPRIVLFNKTKGIIWRTNKLALPFAAPPQDHIWLINIPHSDYNNQLETGDKVDIFVSLGLETVVKKCGILLMCWKEEVDS
ncbi:Toll/interleukin-1 receptor homology (TIR) domain [Dillenia turbinata]|uniref:Toll/interleukin-1 receptor homology (TIR) domain n=1 Tax=Dillenia turbinata TaxID=194707 RepID=A0AAN8Z159_9MAGN